MASSVDVLVIGAGLAGLTCARHVHQQGATVEVIEARDAVGGRMRTDVVDGFRLDRGFQVMLTAYPEARRELDYEALNFQSFYDGALVRTQGRLHRIADPFRQPWDVPRTFFAPVGTLTDKLRVARLRQALVNTPVGHLMAREECSTEEALRSRWGFSSLMIERFFRPFYGGIFFDRSLATSSRMFEFLFKMFAEGAAAVPAEGMQAIPEQIAASLPADAVRLNTRATGVQGQTVTLASGETRTAEAVVVATDAPAAQQLIGGVERVDGRSTLCFYYAAHKPPVDEPILVLNGDGTGLINNIAVMSEVAPSYSPDDRALLSVVVVNPPDEDAAVLEREVRQQLIDWFGLQAGGWTHLRSYHIPYALPDQRPPGVASPERSPRRRKGLYCCGDHLRTGSINGAIAAGRAAAHAVVADQRAIAA
ncbi:NAD(P)/FAD-dependent oxidoreductase [Salisaeta longa]|uniref:NAD(P)/FAD-dependent oxidoreductase n=1 Tax=Salisaeta longa TaxID=503170 RepID=UPI0003B61533|nr:NAD(P)/FAD-dependent oxidoreductase [Salisaeta longa]